MEYVLWTQNETDNKKNTYIIDGIVYEYDGSEKLNKAFSQLLDAREKKWSHTITLNSMSAVLPCSLMSKYGVFIQSHFKERDEHGRRMPFMFLACKERDRKKISDKLEEYSRIIGRNCDQKELDYFKNNKECVIKEFIKIAVIITIIILLITLVWRILEN